MRNLKKLFAVVVVIAVVLTTMIPAAFAEGTTALSADAKACADIGMLVGDGSGVTAAYTQTQPARIQALVMILRLKGVLADAQATSATADNFSDVKAAWEKPLTAYAKAHPELGFVGSNNKFDPDSKIDAKQYYSVMLTALGYSGDYTWATVLSKAASVGLTKNLDVTKFTINDLAVATIETLKAKVKGSDKTLVAVLAAADAAFASKAQAAGLYTIAPITLAVDSITALNLNQIKVVFNKAVDETSAENNNNYLVGSSALHTTSNFELQSDGKTVIITLDTQDELSGVPAQGTTKSITVQNVLAKDSYTETVAKATKDVNFFDTSIPTVTSVTTSGNSQITVNFSEAVKSAAVLARYKLNNVVLGAYGVGSSDIAYASSVTDGAANYGSSVNINFTVPLAAGSYTLTVDTDNAITDMAGFAVAKVDQAVTVANDTSRPAVVSVTGQTNGTVTVMFNKEISNAQSFLINGGTSTLGVVDSGDKKKVTIAFGSGNVLAGANLLTVSKNVTDFYGNTLDANNNFNIAFNATADTTAPTVEGITVVNDTTLKVTFSEILKNLYANNKANYTIKNSGGASQTITSAVNTTSGDKSVVTITTASALTSGTYTLAVANLKDLSDNTIAAVTKSFVSSDTVAPTMSSAEYSAANRQIVITFSEGMATTGTASITDRRNFYYSTNGTTFTQFPSSVTVDVSADSSTVTYAFPADFNVATVTDVRVVGAQDLAGNVVSGAIASATVTDATVGTFGVVNNDSNKPTITANADNSKLTVQFDTDQALTAYLPTNFSVATYTPNQIIVAGKTVKLIYTANIAAIEALGSGISLTVANTNNTDAYGRSLATSTTPITDKVAPRLAGTTPFAVTSATTATLTFNEALDQTIFGVYKDSFTISVNGAPVTINSTTVTGAGNNVITFTCGAGTFTTGDTVTITPNATSNVKDASGNVYAPSVSDDTKTITY